MRPRLSMRAYPFLVLALCVSTSACGDDGGNSTGADAALPGGDADVSDAPGDSDVTPDAPPAPATITVSGTASALSVGGEDPVAGATIAAYRRSDEATAVATTVQATPFQLHSDDPACLYASHM